MTPTKKKQPDSRMCLICGVDNPIGLKPTEAEWEKAARGADGRIYPWGNDPPTQAHAVFGLKEGGAETVSPIGNRDKGKSPYGVHDLAGNLYEWVMDWYDEEFYTKFAKNPAINPRGPSE